MEERIEQLINDYELEKETVMEVYEQLKSRDDLKEEDIDELLELICFDIMHNDLIETINPLTDSEIAELLKENKDIASDLIDEQIEDYDDAVVSIDTIIDQNVTEYLNNKKGNNAYVNSL